MFLVLLECLYNKRDQNSIILVNNHHRNVVLVFDFGHSHGST